MPAETYNKKLKYSKAVKLNRRDLDKVITAFTTDGKQRGCAQWKKVCDMGVRKGKLDESSVDECIAHVSQEVRTECRKQPEPIMTDGELKSLAKTLKGLSSQYV